MASYTTCWLEAWVSNEISASTTVNILPGTDENFGLRRTLHNPVKFEKSSTRKYDHSNDETSKTKYDVLLERSAEEQYSRIEQKVHKKTSNYIKIKT